MGRDAAQISAEIDQTKADLALTIAALRRTDLKGEARGRVDKLRSQAVARAKLRAAELAPVVRQRAETKLRELQPVIRRRAQAKADELKAVALVRGRAKLRELEPVALARVEELKPVALTRVRDKAAELRPVIAAAAMTKLEAVKPLAVARARLAVDRARSLAREAAKDKLSSAAVELAGSRRALTVGGCTLAGGVAVLATRRRLRRRSRSRLQRMVPQIDDAAKQIHRVRERAVAGVQIRRGGSRSLPARFRRRRARG